MNHASEPDALSSPPTPAAFGSSRVGRRSRSTLWTFLGAALTSLALLLAAAIPASAAELMRVTFVRHGESAGNASGLIDTKTPGPDITALGQQQAEAVVGKLGVNNYDGIYASTMVRTQQTAVPMSQYLRLPVQVVNGIQEIEAGVFEGTPEANAANGYAQFPLAWTFQGNRSLRIPGSIDGNEFDARFDGALQTIYDNGDRNPIVYSHGGAIMFWTLMNTNNLTLTQKIGLLRSAALKNTDYVVVEGNPEDGWTLANWNGQQFTTESTLSEEVALQARTLKRQIAAATQQVTDALATGDAAAVSAAIKKSLADVAFSLTKYGRAVSAKFQAEWKKKYPPSTPVATAAVAATFAAEAAPSDQDGAGQTARTAAVDATEDTTGGDESGSSTKKVSTTSSSTESKSSGNSSADSDSADAVKSGNKAVPGSADVRRGKRGHAAPNRGAAAQSADTTAGSGADSGADSGSQQKDAA